MMMRKHLRGLPVNTLASALAAILYTGGVSIGHAQNNQGTDAEAV